MSCLALTELAWFLPLAVTLVTAIVIALNALEYFWVTTGRSLLLIPVARSAAGD